MKIKGYVSDTRGANELTIFELVEQMEENVDDIRVYHYLIDLLCTDMFETAGGHDFFALGQLLAWNIGYLSDSISGLMLDYRYLSARVKDVEAFLHMQGIELPFVNTVIPDIEAH